jgi:ABC-2 type transport system permease protein
MTLWTLVRVSWTSLTRDRVAQALTFLLPIMFFSIFALVFGNQADPTSRVRVAVVDEDQSDYSSQLVAALEQEGGLRVQRTIGDGDAQRPLTRADAETLVREGDAPVALVLPKGISSAASFFGATGGASSAAVVLLKDVSDPVASEMVKGLLQKAAFTGSPKRLATEGMGLFEQYAGPMTEQQRSAFTAWQQDEGATGGGSAAASIGLPIEEVNVLQPEGGDTSMVSFYAAGIGVMFLLFSCSGAAGTLLDEQDSGTLDRLIGSRAGMTGVLLGKWAFQWGMGVIQLVVMFTWGAVVFGLPLAAHLPGFLVMTVVTAAAASAFGLVLATLSRSRAQLSGLSTIIILAMSAMGGSMFPRFLMSDTMQNLGLVTFNAWALDGYIKVFWRDAPVTALWPQVLVLVGIAAVFFSVARVLARRWETT